MAALSAVCFSLSSSAHADISFYILGIPDLDQKRQELPGDGKMYCAPTSAYNLLEFMGTHGIPKLRNTDLDPGNFYLNSDPYFGYDLRIKRMGQYMKTSTSSGTNGANWTDGVRNYIEAAGKADSCVISYDLDEDFPTPMVALAWMSLGGLVSFSYGRYIYSNTPYKIRSGGHVVTLNGVTRYPHHFEISYRDPNMDEGKVPARLILQSTYQNVYRSLKREYSTYNGTKAALYGIGSKPAYDPIKNPLNSYSYIDGYRFILPTVMLSNVTTASFQLGGSNSAVNMRLSRTFDPRTFMYSDRTLGENPIDVPFDRAGDLVPDPVLPCFVHTVPDSNLIIESDYVGGGHQVVGETSSHAIGLEIGGRLRDLFVLERDRVTKMAIQPRRRVQQMLSFEAEAQAFDPINNELVVAGGSTMTIFTDTLTATSSSPLPELSRVGRLILRFSPRSGELFVMRQGDPTLVRMRRGRGGYVERSRVVLAGADRPTAFDFDSHGALLVSDNGYLTQYTELGRPSNGSSFNGASSGDILRFTRDFTNHSDEAYPLPGWANIANPRATLP